MSIHTDLQEIQSSAVSLGKLMEIGKKHQNVAIWYEITKNINWEELSIGDRFELGQISESIMIWQAIITSID